MTVNSADLSRQTALAQHRITRLASALPTHRAFAWLHLHEPQLRAWQLAFLRIPAPPFAEQARAQWFLERFHDLGLTNPHLDLAGNALGLLEPAIPNPQSPILLVAAHLDTVFPAGTPTLPTESPDSPRIHCPGACDNGAGLTALLALIAALRHAGITPPIPILFAANTGEEGEGDLRGMRHLFTASPENPLASRLATALLLEGSGTATAVDRALGSRRFRVTIAGPGGHSWTDFGAPNPILLVARALTLLAAHPLLTDAAEAARTTFSPGEISGGTSINSIPATATVAIDLRATDPHHLDTLTLDLHRTFERVVSDANRAEANRTEANRIALSRDTAPASTYHSPLAANHSPPATLTITLIGDRPAAALPATSPLLQTLRAVDRHLGLRTDLRLGSTDANLPLSLGIPALALAAGGTASGIHTLAEWYDPSGRETALRRILLTLVDTAQDIAQATA